MNEFSWISEQSASLLVECLQDGVYAIENETMVYANPALCKLLGRTDRDIVGRPFIDLVAPQDKELVLRRHRDRIAGIHGPSCYTIRLLTACGKRVTCELHVGVTVNRDGRAIAVGSVRDVTDKIAMEAELVAATEELARIYEQLPDTYYRIDMNNVLTMVSPACHSLLGYTQQEMVGRPLSGFYRDEEQLRQNVKKIASGKGAAVQTEGELLHKNGASVWIMANSSIRYDADGKPMWCDGVARDITTRKRMEEQLTALARTDSLTGVHSRRHFMELAEDLIRLMKRTRRPAALMMADLDNFKKINDVHGHHAGDQALVAFAEAWRNVIRESDLLGRVGGEEFALILPGTPLSHAHTLAERLREATAAITIPVHGGEIGLTVSIGLAELGGDETSVDPMMRRADLALYRAKAEGRNRVACG